MENFKYIKFDEGIVLGKLVYQGSYNCFILVCSEVFYVCGSDTSLVPINAEILNFIKGKQDEQRG